MRDSSKEKSIKNCIGDDLTYFGTRGVMVSKDRLKITGTTDNLGYSKERNYKDANFKFGLF